jgi:hypothetical protein
MGDSVGPFTALFNAGALLAALWAVHLQRKESHAASIHTEEQLAKMGEQLAEFAKAAQAQTALAASQQTLVESQERLIRAQGLAAMATCRQALLLGAGDAIAREQAQGAHARPQEMERLNKALNVNMFALNELNKFAADLYDPPTKGP